VLNLSKLFYSTTESETFFTNIELSDPAKKELSDARTIIRDELRLQLPKLLAENSEVKAAIIPRFFTQGSWAYKTINEPAQVGQQADLDDGTYLPMTFVKGVKPSTASHVFYSSVDSILLGLAQRKAWKLDTSKPTCSRVEISSRSHIDIPLYAIPDHEFATLAKKAADAGHVSLAEAMRNIESDSWDDLPQGCVLLAMRNGTWAESDPRLVNEWFKAQVAVQGEQLRRVVRYLKAWRDWTWEKGGASSLLLMVALSKTYDARDRRDDLAFLDAVRGLPSEFRKGVKNPVQNESLTEKLGEAGVRELVAEVEDLEKYLNAAIMQSTNPEQSISWIRKKLGNRFPENAKFISPASPSAVVLATPASAVASPLVGRTKAGGNL